jgi:abortive infection bacteriophage resistance protein
MLKQSATIEQQIAKLREHGCTITDEYLCKKVLSRVSYYRLSAYFLTFTKNDGSYLPGTDFSKVYELYEFDRKLRRLLFSVVDELEVYLRAQLSYFHAHKYGSDGYMSAANFNARHDHLGFISRINDLVKSNDKLPFVKHHINNYNSQFPLWAVMELFTFGMLSYFYADMITVDQKSLAHNIFKTSVPKAKSWLYCCTNLRNVCAHSRRLYNSIFSVIPVNISNVDKSAEHKLFASIMAVRELYPDMEKWNNEFMPSMSTLLNEYSSVIQLQFIGFPVNWEIVIKK